MVSDDQHQALLKMVLYLFKHFKGQLSPTELTTLKSLAIQAGWKPPYQVGSTDPDPNADPLA